MFSVEMKSALVIPWNMNYVPGWVKQRVCNEASTEVYSPFVGGFCPFGVVHS
jgi:hypothetical protein